MTDQISPADVPEEWIAAAISAARWGDYSASNGSQWDQLRRSVAAVLPFHEQQVRERIAAGLDEQARHAAECHVDGPACIESATYARAAREVRGDGV